MSELGFYHSDRGYWQALKGDAEKLLATYPEGTIEVPLKPGTDYEWQDGAWVHVEPPVAVPDRVTSRQFKLQLLASGLLDQVEAWVAAQDQAVQIAYANSGTFLRTEPMMEAGFAALGFTSEQIDDFYTAAAAL
jgi:hypothetical protein